MKRRSKLKRTRFKWTQKSRTTKTRTILYGKKYADLRKTKAVAANEQCEKCGAPAPYRPGPPGLYDGQLCHNERGAKRSSTIESTWWGCKRCHDEYDGRNQKPCPPKVRMVLESAMPRDGEPSGASD